MRRIHLVAAMAAAAAALGAVSLWAWSAPEDVLRGRLVRWQFWTFELQFIVLAAASLLQLRRMAAALAAPWRIWGALGAVCLLALVLTAGVAPRTPRILFDEQIYQSIGRSLADARLAQMCNDGTVEYGRLQCWSGEYNKQPNGYPYVLSVAYRAVGAEPWVAHAVNNAAAVMLVAVVFLTVAVAFADLRAALLAALTMALIPMQIVWANTGAAEPTAALACALAVLAASHFVRVRTTGALVWMVSATTFAASFRPECLLAVPLIFAIVSLLARPELARPRFWWASAAAVLAGWNVVAHTLAVRNDPWGSSGERLSLDFLGQNLATNGQFYLWDERFPPAITALALVALAAGWRRRAVWAVAAYFVAFWGIFLFFYAGSYDYGADVRYSLMSYAPLAMLSGLGAAALLDRVPEAAGTPRAAAWAGAALLVFHLSMYAPLVRAVGEEAWAARADVEFVDRALSSLPRNAMVFSHVPSLLMLRGVNAAQTSLAGIEDARIRRDYVDRYAGGMYLHWSFWCNVPDPVQQAFCHRALERFDHEIVVEEQVRSYRYALYRLRLREAPPATSTRP
jgi:hypothetical protein